MNVQWRFGGSHPITKEYLGCVTTDSPQEFKLWLAMMCPSSRIVSDYERNTYAVFVEGGYPWRINVRIPDKGEQLLFKLTWGGK